MTCVERVVDAAAVLTGLRTKAGEGGRLEAVHALFAEIQAGLGGVPGRR
jgi:hypothetical protein